MLYSDLGSKLAEGDLWSKLDEGNARECPSLQEKPRERTPRYRTLVGDRTLAVVAKAPVWGLNHD